MTSKKKQAEQREEKDWERIDEAVIKSESFLEKHSKQLIIALGVIVVIVCGYLSYNHFILEPKNAEAQDAMFVGQRYFDMGQDSLALFGDDNGYLGFENIANEYGSTKAGKLAKAYAGICYAHLGNYSEALNNLKGYSGNDVLFSMLVNGTIGDCLSNQGNAKEAVAYYIKAAEGVDNIVHSPILYKKAAIVCRDLGQHDKVIEIFSLLKDRYMTSPAAVEADKYIEEARLLQGK